MKVNIKYVIYWNPMLKNKYYIWEFLSTIATKSPLGEELLEASHLLAPYGGTHWQNWNIMDF